MDNAERQLLEYLADQPRGRGLVSEPHLIAAAGRMTLRREPLVTDIYEGPDGSILAMISQAGIDALRGCQQRMDTK
jgi:hypothetical protein